MSHLGSGRIPCFGWKATKLADLSFKELEILRQTIITDPASANPAHLSGKSIFIYNKAAQRKLDALSWAVTYKFQERKSSNGQEPRRFTRGPTAGAA